MSPKKARKVGVFVVNPMPGSGSTTSLFHARRVVRAGRARFDRQGRLEYLRRGAERITGLLCLPAGMGQMATEREMRHVPIARPGIALGRGQDNGGKRPMRAAA